MKKLLCLFSILLLCMAVYSQDCVFGCFSDLSAMIELDKEGDYAVTPIGFSKDGKFAYIEWRFYDEPYYSEMESEEYRIDVYLIIIDLVTDEELERSYLNGSGRDENTIGDLLDDSTDDFQQALAAYNIIAEYPNDYYHSFPFKGFSIKHMIDEGYIDRIYIEIQSNRGKKVVADFAAENYSWIQCVGLLKSPFEERIAIILIMTYDDYAVGRNTLLKLVGCNLEVGFK
jgi:hypothetical protein